MIVRFLQNGVARGGWYSLDHGIISGGETFPLEDVTLLPPCQPSKIVCVGLNYVQHAQELKMPLPEEPILFLKPPSAILPPGGQIVYPPSSHQVDYEGELGVVIGKRCRDVPAEEAESYILGYTCFNDVTARDLQKKDGQWTRAKSFDTFAPFGPGIARIDPSHARITTRVNGRTVQDSNTSDLIFSVAQLVHFISAVMTLEKGDVIATGTPPGVGPLQRRDRVEVEIEGIGALQNSVG
jgi:2-keto-4-pentenoate hydratase/2-oxohepta-3-ene-1,7-dioic acid hydratase in catechol pathway